MLYPFLGRLGYPHPVMSFTHLGYPPGRSPIANERVLVVDDSATFREIIARMLRSLGALETLTAETPEAGIEILKRKPCGILILDYEMPLLTGAELAQLLRRDERLGCAEAGMILVTGHRDEQRIKTALAKGIDAVLIKPFSMIDLAKRLDAVQKQRFGATLPAAQALRTAG
jgi:CheY-like chemotaxis protein